MAYQNHSLIVHLNSPKAVAINCFFEKIGKEISKAIGCEVKMVCPNLSSSATLLINNCAMDKSSIKEFVQNLYGQEMFKFK
jgi:hypothetical protein